MIPYEDLVAALSEWRVRQGLPTGAADYLGESSATRYDFAAPLTQMAGDSDIVEVGDEMLEGEGMVQSTDETFDQYHSDGSYDSGGYGDDQALQGDYQDQGYGDEAAYHEADQLVASAETVDGLEAVGEPPAMDGELPQASFGEPEATSLDYNVDTLSADDQTHDEPLVPADDADVVFDGMFDDESAVRAQEELDAARLSNDESPAEGETPGDAETADFTRQE